MLVRSHKYMGTFELIRIKSNLLMNLNLLKSVIKRIASPMLSFKNVDKSS
jgi:hypothetical protein